MRDRKMVTLCLCLLTLAINVPCVAGARSEYGVRAARAAAIGIWPLMQDNVFDEYGDLAFDTEKKRLDEFAQWLLKMKDARGYVHVYAGRRACIDEAQARADRAKRYLVKTRGIDAKRIVTVNAGYREQLTVMLFLVSPGARPPVTIPNVDPGEVQLIAPSEPRCINRNTNRPRQH